MSAMLSESKVKVCVLNNFNLYIPLFSAAIDNCHKIGCQYDSGKLHGGAVGDHCPPPQGAAENYSTGHCGDEHSNISTLGAKLRYLPGEI